MADADGSNAPRTPPAVLTHASPGPGACSTCVQLCAAAAEGEARAAVLQAAKAEAEARATAAEARADASEVSKTEAEARAAAAEVARAEEARARVASEARADQLQRLLAAAEAAVEASSGPEQLEEEEGAGGKVEEGGGGAGPGARRHFRGSAILNSVAAGFVGGTAVDGRAALLGWLPAPHYTPAGQTWTLVYSGERDGWMPADFHAACDGRGPTVVLVLGVVERGGREFVAGGYAAGSWTADASGKFVGDPKSARAVGRGSFLFSLVDAAGHGPVQLPLKDPASDKAQAHNNNNGPRFGGGHDLSVGAYPFKPLNGAGNAWTRTTTHGSSYNTAAADAQGCTTFRGPGHPEACDYYKFVPKSLEVFALQ